MREFPLHHQPAGSIYCSLFTLSRGKITENFDLSPRGIREMLGLNKPIYEKTAAYGHFGRDDLDLPWERLDKVDALKNFL